MQDHGKSAGSGGAPKTENLAADAKSQRGEADGTAQEKPQAPAGLSGDSEPLKPKQALEYFQEYEITFDRKPDFSLVEGPGGKGAIVAWNGETTAGAVATGSAAANGGVKPSSDAALVPPPGAVVLAVGGESVTEAELGYIVARVTGATSGGDAVGREDQPAATQSADASGEGAGEGGLFPLVVRFREKTGPRQDDAHATGAGGEAFRNRMKAMATGFGNLFQVREAGGSVVRDGSDVAAPSGAGATAAAAVSDVFVLTFAAGQGTAAALPFTMAEMIGGLGVVVSGVNDDYSSALLQPEELGVSAAGTAAMGAEAGNAEGAGRASEVLTPGAVLLRVAGQSVEGKNLRHVQVVLEAAAAEHLAVSGCCVRLTVVGGRGEIRAVSCGRCI